MAVNAGDAPHARVFTLFHELGHVILRGTGLCDLSDSKSLPPEDRRIEVFCNSFAAAFLVPEHDFRGRLSSSKKNRSWPDSEVKELSKSYSVSREVIVRRLLDLDLTTLTFYRTKRAAYAKEAEEKRVAASEFDQEFRIPYFRMVLRSVGPNYASSVLRAMHTGRISESSAAGCLGVKVKHLGRIEDTVFGNAR